nr:RecName: Full=Conotoxin Bu10; Flags: Precursor [Conus bullatus]
DSRGTQLHRALRKATILSVSARCKLSGYRCKRPKQCCNLSCGNYMCG